MNKKYLLLIVGIGFLFSGFLSIGHNGKDTLAIVYFVLAGVTFTYMLFFANFINKMLIERELLKNKELFDKGILNENEYKQRMSKLKTKI